MRDMAIKHRLAVAVVCAISLCGLASAQAVNIDAAKSTLTVRVFKTGFFSAFAHDHEVTAPIERGSFSESPASVQLSVNARNLQVVDKQSSPSEREKIQKVMLGPEVLNSQEYPEISFRSTHVNSAGEGNWVITGDLVLHGQTHPVTVKVTKAEGRYKGTAQVLQKDFGITPVSIAGGSVKVKNEVRIEFDIAGQ
jgi:polyisoprenoid-binding protein YceI